MRKDEHLGVIIKSNYHHQFNMLAQKGGKSKILIQTFICEKNCISNNLHNYTTSKKMNKNNSSNCEEISG